MRDTTGKSDPVNMTTKDIKGTIRILKYLVDKDEDNSPTVQRARERLAEFKAELAKR
jgi:septation ring formation regulator EzrA